MYVFYCIIFLDEILYEYIYDNDFGGRNLSVKGSLGGIGSGYKRKSY